MKGKNIMHQPVITFKIKDTVAHALKIMNEKNINGAPVVDEKNALAGMVVKADLYRFLISPGHYDTCPLEWVMTKDVITAQEEEDILTISKRLRTNNIVAMPIVEGKKVLGVVSFEDIIDYFIRKQEIDD
ncbi:CBS domain-containing protein [Crassaminicella profunda]|uniref:CBS domain-containing protein n=1 Tax=Crassaminicella profunda TaxID=1286698 RepID=UPI001CA6818E|nr:CBS domain-containing protein [Crassaminicella profunda]QZY55726.1 CBS domain-containing protein [Crassaminicella profunda]